MKMEQPPSNNEPIEPEKESTKETASAEHEPATYEQALEAARRLRVMGMKEPGEEEEFEEDSPQAEIQKAIDGWRDALQPNAQDAIRNITLWVEAGYTDIETLRGVKAALNDEKILAEQSGQDEAANQFEKASSDIQVRLEAVDPKEAIRAKLEAKFNEAENLIKDGAALAAEAGQEKEARAKFRKACGIFYLTLADMTLVEDITDEQRAKYLQMYKDVKPKSGTPPDDAFTGFPPKYKPKKKK